MTLGEFIVDWITLSVFVPVLERLRLPELAATVYAMTLSKVSPERVIGMLSVKVDPAGAVPAIVLIWSRKVATPPPSG